MKLTGAPQRYTPYPPSGRAPPRAAQAWPGAGSSPLPPRAAREIQSSGQVGVEVAQIWHRLPFGILDALSRLGIACMSDLLSAPADVRARIRAHPCSEQSAALVEELLQPDGPDIFTVLRLSLWEAPQRRVVHLENALPCPGPVRPRRAGQTPSWNISLLQAAAREGADIRTICDRIADSRASSSVQESSSTTYDSHLRQIHRICRILGEPAFPASLGTIRRVSSVVGHPSTLRGWLAAWRRLHNSARLAWAADRDPFLTAVQAGLRRHLGPAPPRARCRRSLLRKILIAAAGAGSWEIGGFAVLAYTFGLRVPSELIAQATKQLFSVEPGQISYGPIRRKGQFQLQTLRRWCCCQQDRLLCPHDWLSILFEMRPEGRLFPHSVSHYMATIASMLRELGVPQVESYSSHCFRRGSAVDILEKHGLHAMLRFGQWHSPMAAAPYASPDEQAAVGLALAEASDED